VCFIGTSSIPDLVFLHYRTSPAHVKSFDFLIIKGLTFSNDWLSLREITLNFCSFSKLAFIANNFFFVGWYHFGALGASPALLLLL